MKPTAAPDLRKHEPGQIGRQLGMDVLVLPDDHEWLKDLPPGCIGSDGMRFYVGESFWPKLKDQLIKVMQ